MTKFDTDAINAKADLLAFVERAGGEPRGNGNHYSCACPLHGGTNPTAFSISNKGGKWLWYCFSNDCGGGDAIAFVQKWLNKSFVDACEWINGGKIEDSEGMRVSAEERLAKAEADRIAAQEKEEARRKELQVAELHVYYHKMMSQYHRDEWTKAGIDEGMQDFWQLGGCDDFEYYDRFLDGRFHSPSLTIPILDEQRQLLTIQHRLLNPKNPKHKYHPEKTGLGHHPFLALPEMGYDGGLVLVMEGAKKAMVTWTRCDVGWQCIGVMSQTEYAKLHDVLLPVGSRVIVIPDPNSESNKKALQLGWDFAKSIGGSFLRLPDKIDDYILGADIDQNKLYGILKQARKA